MYILYTKENCKWCNKAKADLREADIWYYEMEHNVDFTKPELQELLAKFNITGDKITLPQIFKDDREEGQPHTTDPEEYIGTYEDLVEYLKKDRTI